LIRCLESGSLSYPAGRGGEVPHKYFLLFIKYLIWYFIWLISCLIVAIPGHVLVFSVLPHYVKYTEPWSLHESVLDGFIWVALFAAFMLVMEVRKKHKKSGESQLS